MKNFKINQLVYINYPPHTHIKAKILGFSHNDDDEPTCLVELVPRRSFYTVWGPQNQLTRDNHVNEFLVEFHTHWLEVCKKQENKTYKVADFLKGSNK